MSGDLYLWVGERCGGGGRPIRRLGMFTYLVPTVRLTLPGGRAEAEERKLLRKHGKPGNRGPVEHDERACRRATGEAIDRSPEGWIMRDGLRIYRATKPQPKEDRR